MQFQYIIKNLPIDFVSFHLGSEERSSTNIEAFEKLKIVASLSAPVAANPSGGNSEQLDRILTKVHNARDKHIFRRKYDPISVYVVIYHEKVPNKLNFNE
jgi:transcriptional regulator